MIAYLREIIVYGISLAFSIYVLTIVKFDKFTNVKQPFRVQLLVLGLAMGLAYGIGSFLLVFIYK